MQLALKSDASLDSAYLNEPSKCRSIICWNVVMVFCVDFGVSRKPGSPEAKDVWMLKLSNFAGHQLATYCSKAVDTTQHNWQNNIETLFLCQDPRAYI